MARSVPGPAHGPSLSATLERVFLCRSTHVRNHVRDSGYYFSQKMDARLWERYGHDRVIRDDRELAFTVGYVLANSVRAGLAQHPREYPFIRSEKYTLDELLQWCEYSEAFLL